MPKGGEWATESADIRLMAFTTESEPVSPAPLVTIEKDEALGSLEVPVSCGSVELTMKPTTIVTSSMRNYVQKRIISL